LRHSAAEDDITPGIFKAVPCTPEEQAKVDVLRTNWHREGAKAMNDFVKAEPSLVLRAMDSVVGDEAVRDAIVRVMQEMGMTRADLDRLMKRKTN
jgi:hypothetical protein